MKEDDELEEEWNLEDLRKEERKRRTEAEMVKPKTKRREEEESGR
jgi:hypothetical protein